MKKLILGFSQFRSRHFPVLSKVYKKLGQEQNPEVLMFTCSDSRVVPSLMTSTGPGDLFVHRCVGNLIPKCTADGASTGDVSEASAVEYAVGVLNIKHILVCGHSNCGAMKALHNGRENLQGLPNLSQWLVHGEPARILLKNGDPKRFTSKLSELDQLSQANVLTQMDHLATYPSVRERLAAGTLTVHGAWFHIESAEMYYYNAETQRFVKIDETELARAISLTN